ncbi:MAG TPA: hypothetical protein EYQ00_03885, partial [Dehalococcoidia bacterium]|nr:hypothetical protein [Dehalococcoidia bacterium]
MKKLFPLIFAALMTSPVFAADLSISIVNLTRGMYFTPLLVAAHPDSMALFTPGAAASVSLQEMAEGGWIASL